MHPRPPFPHSKAMDKTTAHPFLCFLSRGPANETGSVETIAVVTSASHTVGNSEKVPGPGPFPRDISILCRII